MRLAPVNVLVIFYSCSSHTEKLALAMGELTAAMDAWLSNPPENMRAALTEWAWGHGIDCD